MVGDEWPSREPSIFFHVSELAVPNIATEAVPFTSFGPLRSPRISDLALLSLIIGTYAGLGLIFQVGHFAEHAVQFAVWCLGDLSQICGRNMPWMSPTATYLVQDLGLFLFPTADAPRRMMLGMEVLHLIGNSIFLSSLLCLYYCVPSRWVRWALYIEAFHLYEHISLTATAYFLGKPIGMSTLFGYIFTLNDPEFAVGFRVTWHFLMNLLPMPFAMIGLMGYLRKRRATGWAWAQTARAAVSR
jgi:hypothetical protein